MDSPSGEDVLPGTMAQALTRIKNLLKLGMCRTPAVSTGRSSHGPWHLARTEATQLAMSNSWRAQ
jgi:RNA-directed DNA polymerase